jgi:23S rRNA (uracil1939-C5)-methyltransferase
MSDLYQSQVYKICSKTGFGKVHCKQKSFAAKGVYLGEKLQFTLSKNKKSIENIELLEKNSHRVNVGCIHFNECSGCVLQGLSINQQLKWKQEVIEELFEQDKEKIQAIIANPVPFHYRNKVEFTFSQNLKGEKRLGFHQYGSRGFSFSLQSCDLIPSWMVEAKKIVEEVFISHPIEAFYLPKLKGQLKNLILRSNSTATQAIVGLVVQDKDLIPVEFIEELQQKLFSSLSSKMELCFYLIENKVQKGTPTTVELIPIAGRKNIEEIMDFRVNSKEFELKFLINPVSFFQPNPFTAKYIYQKAVELLSLQSNDVLLDLYCGSGTFGMVASHFVRKVVGIEINENAIEDGKTLLTLNGISNMEFFLGDAKLQIDQVLDYKINKMIVDPPRAGLEPKVVETIVKIQPERIVYVSCNPATQKNDVELLKNAGFIIEAILPVDQFTHTPHIENICVLKNSKNRYDPTIN